MGLFVAQIWRLSKWLGKFPYTQSPISYVPNLEVSGSLFQSLISKLEVLIYSSKIVSLNYNVAIL